MNIEALLLAMGVPSGLFGLALWYFKKRIDEKEKRQQEQEKSREQLLLMMMKSTRENTALCTAIAKAVQRIPDAHCNGDMTEALERAAKIQDEEKDLLMDEGIKHIFGD